MKEPVTIAFDVMGADHGLEEVVRGASQLSLEVSDIHAILVGDGLQIDRVLSKVRHHGERISVHHAPHYVRMDERPSEALANLKGSSMEAAVQLLSSGEADAVVTAGNTGAAILAASRTCGLIPGVRRAALAAVFPTQLRHGEKEDPFSLLLDVGASVDASAEDLVTFAVMGATYVRIISQNPIPKVALLSSGSEPPSGPPTVMEAHALLAAKERSLQFLGNIEGVDIPRGTADVVVCDGFVGNVVLKMLEGVAETVAELARYAQKERVLYRVGLSMLSSGLQRLKEVTDWSQYGGAPVLGFERVLIKAHGRSRARAIANAGKVAAKAVRQKLPRAIAEGLRESSGSH